MPAWTDGLVVNDGRNGCSEGKEAARDNVRRWLAAGRSAWVRCNGVGTIWHDDDLQVLAGRPGLRGVVIPKAKAPAQLMRMSEPLGKGVKLVALVETARAVRDLAARTRERSALTGG